MFENYPMIPYVGFKDENVRMPITFVAQHQNIQPGMEYEMKPNPIFEDPNYIPSGKLKDKVVMDIGASTGGFTDVCLQNGAKKVYAIDTGTSQLVDTIKNNPKVVDLSKTNFLTLNAEFFQDIQFICIDVSFVGLTKFTEKLATDFKNVEIVALIKPQFECGLEYARKHKGIVKDEKMHKKVIENVKKSFINANFNILGLIESPIKGGDGNKEFLIYVKN